MCVCMKDQYAGKSLFLGAGVESKKEVIPGFGVEADCDRVSVTISFPGWGERSVGMTRKGAGSAIAGDLIRFCSAVHGSS